MIGFDRAAEFVRPRLVFGLIAGALMWSAWLVGVAFGATNWPERRVAFGFTETDAAGTVVGVDHLAFYAPAVKIRAGLGGEIYDLDKTAAHQETLIRSGAFNGKLEALRNPPFFVLLFLPTAGLPYIQSVWVWTGVSMLAGVVAVRLLGPARPWRTTVWAATFLPSFAAISYGQTSLLSLLVFAGVYRLLARGYLTGAGLLAGLLWFKPPLLLGLFLWWLLDWRRYWPAFVAAGCGGALLYALTVPVVPEAWSAFFDTLRENAKYDSFDWWKAHSARAFWRLLLTPDASPLPTLLWLVSAAAGGYWFVRVWRANRDLVAVPFAAAVVFTLWASPHVMIYDWAVAVAAGVLVWEHAPGHRARWVVVFAVAWAAFFVSTDFGHYQQVAVQALLGRDGPVPGVVQVSMAAVAWAGYAALPGLAPRPPSAPAP